MVGLRCKARASDTIKECRLSVWSRMVAVHGERVGWRHIEQGRRWRGGARRLQNKWRLLQCKGRSRNRHLCCDLRGKTGMRWGTRQGRREYHMTRCVMYLGAVLRSGLLRVNLSVTELKPTSSPHDSKCPTLLSRRISVSMQSYGRMSGGLPKKQQIAVRGPNRASTQFPPIIGDHCIAKLHTHLYVVIYMASLFTIYIFVYFRADDTKTGAHEPYSSTPTRAPRAPCPRCTYEY